MLSTVSSYSPWLKLIKSTPALPYLDKFIASLAKVGYGRRKIQEHARAVAHFGLWLQHRQLSLIKHGAAEIQSFKRHLARCSCVGFKRRGSSRRNRLHTHGVTLFVRHLQSIGVIPQSAPQADSLPRLLTGFRQWLIQHRGAKEATLKAYGSVVSEFLRSMGEDPSRFNARVLRAYVLSRAPRYGRSKAKQLITALRTFSRYLIAQGLCPVGLDAAIPIVAGWKFSTLPRYLPAADVERVLASCDPTTVIGARDRAAMILMSRLGLRSGEVADLRWRDVDWGQATVEVVGKSQCAARLPLSQEVGDVLLCHLANAPTAARSDHIFLRSTPPLGRVLGSSSVSSIAKRAIVRAGVQSPARGAHAMRHSAATSLLAEGASLQSIGVVLRHRLLDTTTIYAKVDFKVLSTLAQPWPGVSP